MDNVEFSWMQTMSKIWASLAGYGVTGWIIAAILTSAIVYFMARYKKMKNEAARAATEKARKEAEVKNPIDNKTDEDDMAAGEDEINKIIRGNK